MNGVLDYLISQGYISEDNDKEINKVMNLYNELMQASDALKIKLSPEGVCKIIRCTILPLDMNPEVPSQDDVSVGLLHYARDRFK